MKKIFIYMLVFMITILIIIVVNISNNNSIKNDISQFNLQYEIYKNKTLQGTDVATIINKAINNNEKNSVSKDSKGFYIEDENSVKVAVIFYDDTKQVQYDMETINKVGINNFINNFNLIEFKVSEVKYNSLGRVNRIMLEQIEK